MIARKDENQESEAPVVHKRCNMKTAMLVAQGQVMGILHPSCPQTNVEPEESILGPKKDWCEYWMPNKKACWFEWRAQQDDAPPIGPFPTGATDFTD